MSLDQKYPTKEAKINGIAISLSKLINIEIQMVLPNLLLSQIQMMFETL